MRHSTYDPNKYHFHSHAGATAPLPYFINWYKTGVQPAITNDSIYWFYRTQSLNANAGTPPVSASTNFGPMADVIYVTANLAAAATLKVTSGSQVSTFNLAAGSTDVQAPFSVGTTPVFELDRSGAAVIPPTSGTDQISPSPQYNDYYYSTGFVNGPPFNSPPSAPGNLAATGTNNVVTLTWSPANPNTGDHVVFTVVVTNQGTGPTPAGTVLGVGFDLDGSTAASVWEDTYTASLAPGASVTLTATGGTAGVNYWTATSGSHSVTAWVDDVNRIVESNENNNKLTQTVTVGGSSTLSPVVQIDAGSNTAVAPFAADVDFNTGNQFSSGAGIDVSGAANPAPVTVYQTCRWAASFSYVIPGLKAGSTYTVRLHFAELTWTAAGQRKFNVSINGTAVLSAFDIFAAAGGTNRAITEQFTTTANASGQITIAFSQAGADNPEVNGIEILQ
jgi:hypothetical protein